MCKKYEKKLLDLKYFQHLWRFIFSSAWSEEGSFFGERRKNTSKWLLWGSIMSGHRWLLSTMIPLSTEKLSTGNPAIFQSRILTGSPKVFTMEKTLEQGISFSRHKSIHSWVASCKTVIVQLLNVIKEWGENCWFKLVCGVFHVVRTMFLLLPLGKTCTPCLFPPTRNFLEKFFARVKEFEMITNT